MRGASLFSSLLFKNYDPSWALQENWAPVILTGFPLSLCVVLIDKQNVFQKFTLIN